MTRITKVALFARARPHSGRRLELGVGLRACEQLILALAARRSPTITARSLDPGRLLSSVENVAVVKVKVVEVEAQQQPADA